MLLCHVVSESSVRMEPNIYIYIYVYICIYIPELFDLSLEHNDPLLDDGHYVCGRLCHTLYTIGYNHSAYRSKHGRFLIQTGHEHTRRGH